MLDKHDPVDGKMVGMIDNILQKWYDCSNILRYGGIEMKKIIMAVAAVMVLSLSLLVGCGGGAPDTLEGTTWSIKEVSMNGQTVEVQKLAEALGESTDNYVVTFGENGQGTANAVGNSMAFEYSYENGKLITGGQTFDVNGDTIVMETGGMSMTLSRR